ncbi:MAG TPA: hypothetical protein VGL58_04485 [Caulobacteraceae bacterium]
MHRLLIAAAGAAMLAATCAPAVADDYPPCTHKDQDHCRVVVRMPMMPMHHHHMPPPPPPHHHHHAPPPPPKHDGPHGGPPSHDHH